MNCQYHIYKLMGLFILFLFIRMGAQGTADCRWFNYKYTFSSLCSKKMKERDTNKTG